MTGSGSSFQNLLSTIGRLLLDSELDATLDWCMFRVRFSKDSGHLFVRSFQSVDEARSAFDAPRLSTHLEHADGTITHSPPPSPVPPIFSNESVPSLGDENFVWRGYGNNKRGVIKMRVGRFLADFNLPTVEDAERFARRMVHLLTAQHDERW